MDPLRHRSKTVPSCTSLLCMHPIDLGWNIEKVELTIVNYLGLARAQLLIKSMPYERYSTICVARLEQGRGGWAIVRNIL